MEAQMEKNDSKNQFGVERAEPRREDRDLAPVRGALRSAQAAPCGGSRAAGRQLRLRTEQKAPGGLGGTAPQLLKHV